MSLSKIQIGFISLVLVILDFLSKNIIEKQSYVITNFLHLRFAREYAKFDLIPQLAPYASHIAIIGSILSLIIMGYFYTKYYYRTILFAIGMIMAGILGNLIDKIQFGWSRVFIDIHHSSFLMFFDTPQFPLFNFADVLIVWGALIFIFSKKW